MRNLLAVLSIVGTLSLGQAACGAETVRCVVTADSTLASPRFAPFRLFDGDRTDPESRWASARSPEPHWVVLTFPKPISVDRVVVHAHERPELVLGDAAIQIRAGDVWRTLATVEANEKTPVEFTFAPCETRSLRLWITDACRRDSTARLFEIALFSEGKRIELTVPRRAQTAQPTIDDRTLLDSVRPLLDSLFAAPDETDANGQLLVAYARAVTRWGDVLAERIVPVPGRSAEAYYGRGGNQEDDVRPIAYAVMVHAFLSRLEGDSRRRDDAVAALRYLTASHVTGPSTCLNGKKWGNAWQSAMWTRAAGLGAWFLWDELDRDLRLAAARLIEYEADRFIDQPPKSSVNRDTGAEENAWNALILSLAANMMPEHPRADAWNHAARRYMYNVLSVPADREDDSLGDEDRPIRTWVTTVNAHPDFTVENHGLVHIGYQKTSIAQLLENTVHYLIADNRPPLACRHHVAEATELLYRCVGWDGAPVYFGGNDWKLVHTQPTDLPIYAVQSIVSGDRRAALQERRGLDRVTRLQAAEDGFFGVRRDLEYGGLCASRLVACYLARAANGPGTKPLLPDEFDRQMTGVRHLPGGRAVLHRTPDKFASFAFGPKWMALTVPAGADRAVWPHYASYLGVIDGEAPTQKQAEKIRLSSPSRQDAFWTAGRLQRRDGNVEHDFAFVSPATSLTVYVERLRYPNDFRPRRPETGIVGHEYEIGSNRRTVFGRFGSVELQGYGGEQKTHELPTDWLQVGDRIGYVVKRFPETPNVVRYHDTKGGNGRVPKLQEWFSLIGDADECSGKVEEQWACIVTIPNPTEQETERCAGAVKFEVVGAKARIELRQRGETETSVIHIDFADHRVEME